MIFSMMQQQQQDQLNQMKGSNKKALEMAHQSIKQMSEQMMAMYNSVQAA